MPARKLKAFLDEYHVRYVQVSHNPAYTAQELAEATHIPGKELAKSVVAILDGVTTLIVLPASYKIDFSMLEQATGARQAELASEEQCQELFPGCEVGAMSPFANLYGIEALVESVLREDEFIAFHGETHTSLVRLAYSDFERLVNPQVAAFSVIRG